MIINSCSQKYPSLYEFFLSKCYTPVYTFADLNTSEFLKRDVTRIIFVFASLISFGAVFQSFPASLVKLFSARIVFPPSLISFRVVVLSCLVDVPPSGSF